MSEAFGEIPDELKARDQWLMWDAAADTPRRPHYQGDFGVSWTDPDDWHSFEDVVEAAAGRESWGIGYVFAAGNDDYPRGVYGALDLDGCVGEDGTPADWLPSLQPFFDAGAYVEYSPSGEGIHVPLAGFEPPEWWSDVAVDEHEGVEAYGSKFFTFTGDTLQGSGDGVADTGAYAEEWLREAAENITGERPGAADEPDERPSERHERPAGGYDKADGMEDVLRAIDDLDARDVAEKTIVSGWNDGAASGDNRAFYPTWGPNCNGTANIVDAEGWTDTGTDSGSGGPLEMAAIDLGELNHSGCQWGDASGSVFGKAVDHLRDLGFDIPEVDRSATGEDSTPDASRDLRPDDDASEADRWDHVRAVYADEEPKLGREYAAGALEERTAWMYVKESEVLWVYDAETGYFNPWGAEKAAEILEAELGPEYSRREKEEILERIKARNQAHREELNAGTRDRPLVCVANGVLDVVEQELTDHSPDYRFTRGVPHEWDPEAVPERTLRFLREVTKRDCDARTLLQQLGHGLLPGHPYKAFVVMHGPGDNGKSAVGQLFRRFVANENAASVELRDFREDDFATGDLPGKMINVGDDLSGKKIRDVSMLKRLTGGDTLRANEKHKATFDFQNEAAMFFSGNEPPVFAEKTDALKGRLYPIHMPYRFTQEDDEHRNANPRLIDEIVDDAAEMSGLLNLAARGARELEESGGEFAMPESPQERMAMYEAASDPIRRFVMENLKQGGPDDVILKDDCFDVYAAMCRHDDERAAASNVFKGEVSQQAIVDVEKGVTRRLKPGDGQEKCWKYVTFSDDAREYMSRRLKARYFPEDAEDDGDDAAAEAADEDAEPAAYNATPIADVADALTGYVTVTGEVAKTMSIGDTGTKAMVKDESGMIDVIAWEDPLATALGTAEGECLAIRYADVREHEGDRQLVLDDDYSEVERIQQGVGHTAGATPDKSQADLDTAADGGGRAPEEIAEDADDDAPDADDAPDRDAAEDADGADAAADEPEPVRTAVRDYLRVQTDPGDTVTAPSVAGRVDHDPSDVAKVLRLMATDSRLVTDSGGGCYERL